MNATQTNNSLIESPFSTQLASDELMVDQIGKTVARSLDKELSHLSPKILQKLEASRDLALSKQKKGTSSPSSNVMGDVFSRFGLLGPVLVVMVLVISIAQWQKNARINDLADVDSALLSDTVPPGAYADEGFKLYMKKMLNETKSAEAPAEQAVDPSTAPVADPAPEKNSLSDPSNNQ